MSSEPEESLESIGAKKSPLVPIVLVVNSVVVLAVGAYLLLGSGGKAAEHVAGAAPAAAIAPAEPGSIPIDPDNFAAEEMKAFIVNLNGEDGNRYLKMAVTVRLRDEAARERFTMVRPAVRDQFIRHLTSLTLDDLGTAEKKTELKKELVARANRVLLRGDVLDVYFTEFVIQ